MTRPRGKHIKVFGTEAELAAISARAASANLSLSAYLRAAGLNQKVRSVLDVHAVEELSKVNGELGRAAAVVKLWLEAREESPRDVARLLKEFRDLQKMSHEIMGRMMR